MTFRYLFLVTLVGSLCACAELPGVATGECGNRVLEPGEDCDGASAFEGATCGAPAEATACRYVCDPEAEVSGCPAGWGCGDDRICRQPSGTFPADETTSFTYPFRVDDFTIGDIDGDGNVDLIGNADETITMRYGTGDGEFPAASSFIARAPTGDMSYGYFDNDELLDVLVPIDAGLFVLLGDESGSLNPVPYSSLPLPGNIERFIAEPIIVGGFPHVITIGDTAQVGFISVFGAESQPLPNNHKLADIIGPIAVGNVHLELDLMSEIVVAFEGEAAVWIFSIDNLAADPDNDPPIFTTTAVSFPLPAPVSETHPFVGVVDVNGDNFLDLVAVVDQGNGPQVAIAKNNKVGSFEAAAIDASLDAIASAGVLAVAELDGLPEVEVVTKEGIFSPLLNLSAPIHEGLDPWAEAIVTDINGDGAGDVVAAPEGESRIELIYGTGLPVFNARAIVTDGPIKELVDGDFDGDLVADVGFVIDREGPASSLFAIFGSTSGGPSEPIFTGNLENIVDVAPISLLADDGTGTTRDLITDLFVISRPASGTQLSLAIFEGDASRRLVAPFKLFTEDFDFYRPVQAVFGNFTDDGATDVVAVSELSLRGDGPAPLDALVWVIPGKGEGGALDATAVQRDTVTHADNAGLRALRCSKWVPGDLDVSGPSAGIDELVGLNYGQGCASNVVSDPSAYVAKAQGGAIDLGEPLPTSDTLLTPARLVLIPLDADGANDLLVFYAGEAGVPDSAGFAVYWGHGDGSLAFNGQTVSDFGLSTLESAVAGEIRMRDIAPIDLDGDGFPEIAILTDAGVYYVSYAKDGDHKIYNDPKVLVPGEVPGARRLAVADVNRDGLGDVAVTAGESVRIFLQRPAPPLGDAPAAADADGGAL